MGLIVPSIAQAAWQNNLPATPTVNAAGTTITAHASINTKGSYTELFSATTYDSYGFWLATNNSSANATDTSMLLDIAIGAAASEVVIFPNYLCGYRTGIGGMIFVPLFIPKGSRVSARIQALISADDINVVMHLNGGRSGLGGSIFVGCDAYGVNTADSGGTAHTPGNTGTESTDANVGSVLSRDYGAVLLGLGHSGTGLSANAVHWELTDGTNTLAEWWSQHQSTEQIFGPWPPVPFNMKLAGGTQLQIQAEASGTGDANDVAFYCFY